MICYYCLTPYLRKVSANKPTATRRDFLVYFLVRQSPNHPVPLVLVFLLSIKPLLSSLAILCVTFFLFYFSLLLLLHFSSSGLLRYPRLLVAPFVLMHHKQWAPCDLSKKMLTAFGLNASISNRPGTSYKYDWKHPGFFVFHAFGEMIWCFPKWLLWVISFSHSLTLLSHLFRFLSFFFLFSFACLSVFFRFLSVFFQISFGFLSVFFQFSFSFLPVFFSFLSFVFSFLSFVFHFFASFLLPLSFPSLFFLRIQFVSM